jgi:16S rRNA (guanine966-N2)-methyltransferase
LNEVRIIGGKWKRRKLAFPDRPTLRPTPNRARETLFNWLMGHLDGARCLDLFAGSGALGFEALSRGAAEATLVDSDAEVVKALKKSRQLLAADNCTVVHASALAFLEQATTPWDIVFLDPPFASRLLAESLEMLAKGHCLREDSIVYVEVSAHDTPDLSGWRTWKEARAGDVRSMLLLRDLS